MPNNLVAIQTLPSSQVVRFEISASSEYTTKASQSVIQQTPQCEGRRQRRPSFLLLESDNQIIMERMIRQEIKQQGRMNRKMSLQEGQTCLCTSDIYAKSEAHWKNRETTKLTTKKLESIPIDNISKIKLLNEHPMTGYNLFRVTAGEREVRDFAIGTKDSSVWFGNALWICLVSQGHELTVRKGYELETEGFILKRSQFLKNWQLRYVHISTKNGLTSCRKKGQSPTVKIKETSELWSRLETINHQNVQYVIIKVWHKMFKYQFAVPADDCIKWARALSTLVK